MMKRILSLLLALLMVVSAIPVQTFAEGEETENLDVCPACGEIDCGLQHISCEVCGDYDCGVDHNAAAVVNDACPVCGELECGLQHISCEVCGDYDCEADHGAAVAADDACPVCGELDCGLQHTYCEVCVVYDCGVDHSAVADVAMDLDMAVAAFEGARDLAAGPEEPALEIPACPGAPDCWGTADGQPMNNHQDSACTRKEYLKTFVTGTDADGVAAVWNTLTDAEKADVMAMVEAYTSYADALKEKVGWGTTAPENPCGCCDDCTGVEDCECVCDSCTFKKNHGAVIDEGEPEPNPMVGRLVKLVAGNSFVVYQNPTASGNFVGASAFPEVMKIKAVSSSGSTVLYQLVAADGYTWPTAPDGNNYEGYYLDSTRLELIEEKPEEPENPCGCCEDCTGKEGCECVCGECDFCEPTQDDSRLEETVTDSKGNVQTITVAGDTLPSDVKLFAADADVSEQFAEFGIPEMNKVFGLDIKLQRADDTEYQPDSKVQVKISVDAEPGTLIGILHTHGDDTTFMGVTEVLSDGTIEFATDGFSEFAGFTVDFHYNGVDFSIDGMTSILLSDLFEAMGINEDVSQVTSVVFSDNTLVDVVEEGNDWRLTSLKAFQTEETLVIAFYDGDVLTIGVTDAVYYNSYLDGLIVFQAGTTGILGPSQDSNFVVHYVNGSTASANVKHYLRTTAKESAITISRTGYWYHVYDWTYAEISTHQDQTKATNNIAFTRAYGDPTVHIQEYSTAINLTGSGAGLVTVSIHARTSTGMNQRNVVVKLNGNEVARANNVPFPDRTIDAANVYNKNGLNFSWYDSSKYYAVYDSNTGNNYSFDGTTYTINLYSRYNVSFDANGGSGSMPNQAFVYGTAQNLNANAFTAPTFTVSYESNGGTAASNATSATQFASWNTKADGFGTKYTNTQNVNNLTTEAGGTFPLYAQWTATSNVTLPSKTAVTKTGYTLEGWYEDQALTVKAGNPGASYTPKSSIKLYAKWTPNIYKVTLDNQSATTAGTVAYWYKYNTVVNNVYYYTNSDCTAALTGSVITKPTKVGYTFGGYYTEKNGGGTQYVNADGLCVNNLYKTFTEDKTLYAKWTVSTYTITYDLKGGSLLSGKTNPTSYNAGTDSFTLNNPEKTGYTFTGWTGTGLNAATKDVTIPTGSTGDRSYTATWSPNTDATYTVHYYVQGSTEKVQDDKVAIGLTFNQVYTETAPGTIGNYILVGSNTQSVTAGYTGNEITFYYKLNAFSVSYAYTGSVPTGAPAVPAAATKTVGSSVNVATAPTLTGYTFSGWSTSDATISSGSFTMPNHAVTFTGSWTPITYTISYNLNGGSVTPPNPTSYTVESAPITLNNPTKTGYTFAGWTGTGLNAATKDVTIPTGSTGDRSYTATWSPNTDATYTVHYYVQGSTEKVQDDKVATGQTFNQVYTETAPEIIGNYIIVGEKTKTVTAGYSNNVITFYYKLNAFSVTYQYDGTAPEGAPTVPAESTETVGSSVSVAAVPTLTGYTFSGWSADGIAITDGTFTMPNHAVTLTGSWTPVTYTISYNLNGGSVTPPNPTSYTVESAPITLNNPTKTGYTFAGWTGTGLNAATKDVTIPTGSTGDRSYTATWTPITYTITYDYADGTTDNKTVNYDIEDDLTLESAPSREGYKFTGWKLETVIYTNWTAGDYDASYNVGTGKYGNVTFKAQWEEQYRYELKFDANGGSNPPATMTQEWCDDASKAFTWTTVPTRNGYTFKGWAEAADSTENVAGEGKNTYTLTGIPAQTVEKTLYAIWERQTGNLQLDYNGDGTPVIVTITGKNMINASEEITITVVITGDTTITDLPTGTYTVTAQSARATYTASATPGSANVESGKTAEVDVTISTKGTNWFTGFSRVINTFKR